MTSTGCLPADSTHFSPTCPSRAGATGTRLAFTLIEMLIVVMIIVILSVLLLSALRGARGAARLTQCMTHLKNLVAGVNAFGQEPGNKGFGPPGPPNAFCQGNLATGKANQNAGVGPNTIWNNVRLPGSGPSILGVPRPLMPMPQGSRFVNHGFLYARQLVTDDRVYNCPDMQGLWTWETNDPNSFAQTISLDINAPDPTGAVLAANPWMSSYDYRSCYDYRAAVYSTSSGGVIDYSGPYVPVDVGARAAETAVLADTIQNPAGQKITHENTRYNVVFLDGHGVTFNDAGRLSQISGGAYSRISDLNLNISGASPSIGPASGFWWVNEFIWAELLSKPER